jgi:hypothetical protein
MRHHRHDQHDHPPVLGRPIAKLGVLLGCLLTLACTPVRAMPDAGMDGSSGPVPPADLALRWRQTWCEAWQACPAAATTGHLWTSVDACLTATADWFSVDEDLRDVGLGRLRYDDAVAEDCLAHAATTLCQADSLVESYAFTCPGAFTGQLPMGAVCLRDAVCADGQCLHDPHACAPGHCAPRATLGQPCDGGNRCATNLTCSCGGDPSCAKASCQPSAAPGELGAACTSAGCAKGLQCIQSLTSAAGLIGTCTPPGGKEEPCVGSSAFACKAGLVCIPTPGPFAKWLCRPPLAEGATCPTVWTKRPVCQTGLVCTQDAKDLAGSTTPSMPNADATCRPWKHAGEPCTGTTQCAAFDLYCKPGPGGGICSPLPGRGEPCAPLGFQATRCRDGLDCPWPAQVCSDVPPGGPVCGGITCKPGARCLQPGVCVSVSIAGEPCDLATDPAPCGGHLACMEGVCMGMCVRVPGGSP